MVGPDEPLPMGASGESVGYVTALRGPLALKVGERLRVWWEPRKKYDGVVIELHHLLGSDCMYGRTWGCARHVDSLHFELCYYQAIEAAIELKLPRCEEGPHTHRLPTNPHCRQC